MALPAKDATFVGRAGPELHRGKSSGSSTFKPGQGVPEEQGYINLSSGGPKHVQSHAPIEQVLSKSFCGCAQHATARDSMHNVDSAEGHLESSVVPSILSSKSLQRLGPQLMASIPPGRERPTSLPSTVTVAKLNGTPCFFVSQLDSSCPACLWLLLLLAR